MNREEQIEKLTELLDEDWHTIQFSSLGWTWTISHPLCERLDGSLFDCKMDWNGRSGQPGRYKLNADGTLGTAV